MAARFATNLVTLVVGAALACCALAMPPYVAGWLGLAAGAVVLIATLAGFATRGRGSVQRALDLLVGLLATWTVVASRTFAAGRELHWLMFASAAAFVLLAVEGLIAHEVVAELTIRRAVGGEVRLDAASAVDQPAPIRVAG